MDTQQMNHFLPAFMGVIFIFMIVAIVVMIIPYWKIFQKAGFPPALSLLVFIPLANIIVLYYVAFTDWKVVPAPYPGYPPTYPPTVPPSYPPTGYPPPQV
jgi:hypothetical protein